MDSPHDSTELPHIKTRGQLRQLCRALKIELPVEAEAKAGQKSRSVMRREAAQRGKEPPEFGNDGEATT